MGNLFVQPRQELANFNARWEILPYHFKKDVVEHLDFKSRNSLQLCSSTDYDLVKSCPVFLEEITLRPPNKLLLPGGHYSVPKNRLVEMFIEFFNHPKSVINTVKFDMSAKFGREYIEAEFLPILLEKLKINPKFQARTKVLAWDGYFRNSLGEKFLQVLKHFNADDLECLNLCPEISSEYLDVMCETKQWKNAKKLVIIGNQEARLDKFLHFNELTIIRIDSLRPEEACSFIQNFISKNPPFKSFFQLQICNPMAVQDILQELDSQMKIDRLKKREDGEYYRQQHFQLFTDELVLVVEISDDFLYGTVCRRQFWMKDYYWATWGRKVER
ncbi:unnamed protein product [Caenorhabditis brenneri]